LVAYVESASEIDPETQQLKLIPCGSELNVTLSYELGMRDFNVFHREINSFDGETCGENAPEGVYVSVDCDDVDIGIGGSVCSDVFLLGGKIVDCGASTDAQGESPDDELFCCNYDVSNYSIRPINCRTLRYDGASGSDTIVPIRTSDCFPCVPCNIPTFTYTITLGFED